MEFILISFTAGVLTALAPCVLPIIPVVLGGSLAGKPDKRRPFVVVGALAVSIVLFTLLLKASTLLIMIPESFWRYFSGFVIILFGLSFLIPKIWVAISLKLKLYQTSNSWLGSSFAKKGWGGALLVGFALGPVFSSCSPVYLFILATVLPRSFSEGLLYIFAYTAGLCLVLLLVGIAGQALVRKLRWATNPNGWFKHTVGILLIAAGLMIVTGYDRKLQTYVIDRGILDITKVEDKLLKQNN